MPLALGTDKDDLAGAYDERTGHLAAGEEVVIGTAADRTESERMVIGYDAFAVKRCCDWDIEGLGDKLVDQLVHS